MDRFGRDWRMNGETEGQSFTDSFDRFSSSKLHMTRGQVMTRGLLVNADTFRIVLSESAMKRTNLMSFIFVCPTRYPFRISSRSLTLVE